MLDKLTKFDQFANLIKIKTVLLKKLLYNITAGKAYISFDIPKKVADIEQSMLLKKS